MGGCVLESKDGEEEGTADPSADEEGTDQLSPAPGRADAGSRDGHNCVKTT